MTGARQHALPHLQDGNGPPDRFTKEAEKKLSAEIAHIEAITHEFTEYLGTLVIRQRCSRMQRLADRLAPERRD